MASLREWRRGPIATVAVAWLVCSGALVTTYFVAQARSAERMIREMGFRLGPGADGIRVNWMEMWPQVVAIYLIVVIVPPGLLWLLWRRAQRLQDSR
jgi:hypothetical protein